MGGDEVSGAFRRPRDAVPAPLDASVTAGHGPSALFEGRLDRATRCRWGASACLFQPHGWSFEAVTGPLRLTSVLWERLGARKCERIICVSEAERGRGRRAGVRARMEVVLSGVSTDGRVVSERSAARAELGLPPGPLVVCVGRLCEAKGQDQLLAVWPRIVGRVPSAHLVLVGEGTVDTRLQVGVGTSVLLAGLQDDVLPWLTAADVVVARRDGRASVSPCSRRWPRAVRWSQRTSTG